MPSPYLVLVTILSSRLLIPHLPHHLCEYEHVCIHLRYVGVIQFVFHFLQLLLIRGIQ